MESQKFSKDQYPDLPHQPGVYKFFNNEGVIIYVGKAKNLHKRVASYFSKSNLKNRKTQRLVSEIIHIEIIIVNTEFDALLLENGLIKENQPRYNILLKDDKSFPSICITNEPFPRVFSTRRIDPSLGTYFGPYTSVKAMNGVLDLIRKLYKIRTCNFNLSPKNIESGKFKVCLEYHIGNCLGPCEGLQQEPEYLEDISHAKEILKGNINSIKHRYRELMSKASEEMNYEAAHTFKSRMDHLEKFQSRSLIVNPKVDLLDVLSVVDSSNRLYINYMKIEEGAIRNSETFEVKMNVDEPLEEVLQYVLFNLRNKYSSSSTEVLSNQLFNLWDGIVINQPKIGDKKKLINLSLKNALYFKNERQRQKEASSTKGTLVLEKLKSDLNLQSLPTHIECFDNSNIQGTNPVASMVCFKNGKPAKSDYRKFHIKTVIGPDDFASMREIVTRRYSHLQKEGLSLPDLIVIDGGKGQLSSACEALKSIDLYGAIPIIGIAKRLEEIYFPEDSIPIHISKKSISLKLLQHLRDEAHRFAITFHRDTRSKNSLKSELDNVPGIGSATREKLLGKFKSMNRIKSASENELIAIVGRNKSRLLLEYLQKKRGHK